jgi:hypothetical protein
VKRRFSFVPVVTFVFDGFYATIRSGIGCGKVGQENQKLETQRASRQGARRKFKDV